MPISPPSTAPDFELEHVVGHKVSFGQYKGQRIVITFGGKESSGQIEQGIGVIRKQYDPDQLTVIGVSDLSGVPKMVRAIARSQMKKAYEGAVKAQTADLSAGKTPPADPSSVVIMLMDWSGDVTKSYGVTNAENEASAVVIDASGSVVGTGTGAQLGEQILAALGSTTS